MCVAICPFGAMSFDNLSKQVIKCDLCDGDPQCVRFCETQAVTYVDASEQSATKQIGVADKLTSITQKVSAAIATE